MANMYVCASGVTEISQDAVVFDSRLHVTQETFTIFLPKVQEIFRKQKIRSSHAYHREAENSPNPTTKPHLCIPHAISYFLAKMLHQTTISSLFYS